MVAHTASWYAGSLPAHLDRLRDRLDGDTRCDVCIVGAGFAGVSTAYHLAKAGQRVILLDTHRVGWGASGRNGGQLHPGLREDLQWFHENLSPGVARKVLEANDASLAHFDGLIDEHAIPCDRTHGLLSACRKQSDLDEQVEANDWAQRHYGVAPLEVLDRQQAETALGTGGHVGATREHEGGHVHPLAFVTSLAEAAEKHGAQIHDQTEVLNLDDQGDHVRVLTSSGTVTAEQVVLCGNGYMRGLHRDMDARVLPITNFIVATKPIGAGKPGGILPAGDAASDTRFIVRYWRPTPDGRLLFGGGEKFSKAFPKDIEAFVRPYLADVYPELADTEIDHAWGGTLAITQTRLPLIRKLAPRITVAAGFSGQGVLAAPFAGKIIADSLTHDPSMLDLFSSLPCPAFPGGTALRGPILFLAMSYFALMDRFG
jgi:gamma-glutamylputrescine oxidase